MNTTRKDIDIRAMQLEQGPLLEVKNLQVDFTTCLLYTSDAADE